MTGDCAAVGPGGIRFYDAYTPSLDAGDYRVDVQQDVTPPGAGAKPETYQASQQFSVAAPRWSLPPEDVYSVFPARGAVGAFGQQLPHVVLTKADLPWERDVFANVEPAGRAPWLAVLVFGDGEQIAGVDALLAPPATTPVAELFERGGSGVLWPDIKPEWYEEELLADDKTVCTVIDVSPAAFAALVPGPDDLRYLAHVRQVDATAKDADVLHISGDGWYSVVVAPRLPAVGATAQRNTAHLVSLEGFAAYAGRPLSAGSPPLSSFARVRMISLCSWEFTCVPGQGGSFADLINGLLEDGAAAEPTALRLSVSVPIAADEDTRYAAAVLERGYVPMRYDTRPGERTFGWYRGPFSPVAVPRFVSAQHQTGADPVGWTPFGTASAALVYDRARGVFDLSYAVAFETGRAMALADEAFSSALVDWRRQGHRLLDMILERRTQVPELASFDPEHPPRGAEHDLLEAIRSYTVTSEFMKSLVTRFGGELAPQTGAPGRAGSNPSFPGYADPPAGDPSTIRDLLGEPVVTSALRAAGAEELGNLADWLALRYLLIGVPFDALVADSRLLPPESIRFFHLDANWLDALIEGALSVGIESSRDVLYQDLVKALILDTTMGALHTHRAELLGEPVPDPPPVVDPPEMAGMLLRSALVTGWPGLEVRAYTGKPAASTEIPLLRMERLSSGVLLCLWPSVPAAVTVDEPSEGVAFGLEDPPEGSKEGPCVYLRSLDRSTYGRLTGARVDASAILDTNRRLVLQGADGALTKLSQQLSRQWLEPRDFAVQIIKVPEQGVFEQIHQRCVHPGPLPHPGTAS